jgi:hypothetical protein
MIYQLPNGKTVYLSLEEYLSLTDEDIQYLVSTGHGSDPVNPFHASALSNPRVTRDKDEEPHDKSIDYKTESDDIEIDRPINMDNLSEDDVQ